MTAQEKLAPLAAKLHAALADEKQRVNLLVCTGLAGLVLLGVTAWLPAGNSTQSPQTVQTDTAADYATQLESRLTALISRVEGAGKTAVMVTLESGSESIYATDTDADDPCAAGQRQGRRPCRDRADAAGFGRGCCVRGRRQRSRTEPRDRAGGDIDRRRREPHHRCKNGIDQIEEEPL